MQRSWHLRSLWMIAIVVAAVTVLEAAPALAADSLYWGNWGDNTIAFANLDGRGGGALNATGAAPEIPNGVAIDPAANKIYWANNTNSTISFANLDGSGGGQLNTTGATPDHPYGVAIDPTTNKIYWANANGTISFANLDDTGGGGQLNTNGATLNAPEGVAVDPATNKIYWANTGNNTISFANLDDSGGGGELNTAGGEPDQPIGVAVYPAANRIYWSNFGDNTLSYANLDNSGGEEANTIGATLDKPLGVAVDPAANKIYTVNFGNGTISYANLTPGGGGQLPTAGAPVSNPAFPALLEVPSATGAPSISGGSAPGSVLSCSQGSWAPDQLASLLYQAPQSFAYSWTLNGATIPGATSSSINATSGGKYACKVTASNHAGSASQTSSEHSVAALSCTLGPQTPHVLATTLAQTAKKHKKTPKGQLKLTVNCNETGQLAASGTVTAVLKASGKKHKHKTKHYKVKPAHISITSGISAALTLKLPKAALSALKAHAKESITFTLTVTNSAGSTTTTTVNIKHVKLKHK